MVTSKDLVKKAIEFKKPARVPYNFDSNRTPETAHKYGDDFEWVFVDPDPGFVPSIQAQNEWENEWGIIYNRLSATTMGEARYSPLGNSESVATFRVPDFANPLRYKSIEQAVREKADKYIMGMFPHFMFLQMLDLFGFENLMMQFFDERDAVEHIADLLTDSCLKVAGCMADRGVDGIIAIEDLGVQDRLIISPNMWREMFKPRYAKVVDAVHARGMHFLIHSCGYIFDLIEDMIEIGVDVVQLDQQDNMGIDRLAERYAGRICFFCSADIQTTLPKGSLSDIEAKAKHLIKAFGSKDGGFMAKTYPQPEAIEIPEKNTAAMCVAFKKYGVYPLKF